MGFVVYASLTRICNPSAYNLSYGTLPPTEKKLRPIPIIGIFVKTLKIMAKNTSILLGDYFENFINQQIRSGKFASASEVMRAALRLFEYEQSKKDELIKELKKGEKSGFVKDFDRAVFLENIHEKHLTE
jgi:antitoxin ParD1/3/4